MSVPTHGSFRRPAEPTFAPRSSAAFRPFPVYLGELQARALGANVQAWTSDGRSLTGKVGELVVHRADAVNARLILGRPRTGHGTAARTSSTNPGVWRHGDWIEITQRGTAIIYRALRRHYQPRRHPHGTSEIYRAVLAEEAVLDALTVDLPRPGTEGWMPLFVVLRDGMTLDEGLAARIKRRIRVDCSAAARPRRDPPDRRGAAHTIRQTNRGTRQAHPNGRACRPRYLARRAGQSARARHLRRTRPGRL